jgi:hypothetical protein
MPDLAALRQNCAKLEFDYGGARFTAYYRPLDVDDEVHQAVRGMGIGGDMDPFYAQLSRLVVWWDATDGGVTVMTTVDAFKRVGVGICGTLMNAILRDVGNPTWAPSPLQARQTHSSNGSSPTANSAPHPTTTTSSSAPSGQDSPPGISPDSPAPLAVLAGVHGSAG